MLDEETRKQRRRESCRRYQATQKSKDRHKKYVARPEVRERMKEASKRYWSKPETKKRWAEVIKPKVIAYHNRPEIKERIKAWRKEYLKRPEVAARKAEYERNYRQTKGKQRLYRSLSTRIREALLNKKDGMSWEKLVGYTREQLATHIERQFTRGMSWGNQGVGTGKWHLDHIIPISHFKFENADDPEFKACWSLPNLRPCWAEENIRKSNRREHLL